MSVRCLKIFLLALWQVIRGTAATPCSQLLSLLDPALRRAAGLGAWQIISPASGTATGKLEVAERMAHVQHASYREPTVLLVDSIGGEEDIPEVCQPFLDACLLANSR